MKLVVDSNIIISALMRDSTSRKIINHFSGQLLIIPFLESEIHKYKELVMKKANISEDEFDLLLQKLYRKMVILDNSVVLSKMVEAADIMDQIDPDDTHFIAAALATNSDIWSDDKHFEKQDAVKVWKTQDLFERL
ncbi:MAG: hypothetical protein CMH61_01180 [Nanoarchaeota archaeon]|nr:hypothetical protein [Nanoarchaeota archaeon]|tara:strand:- start:4005 stop:4412 length:408 start_codon:yes stop_codon:yes gene_type:complete